MSGPLRSEALAEFSVRTVRALLKGAGAGHHHVVCAAPVEQGRPETSVAVGARVTLRGRPPVAPSVLDSAELAEVVTVLMGALSGSRGGVVVRTVDDAGGVTVRGWRVAGHKLQPLSEQEVRAAYGTSAATGEPVALEPGVIYAAGFPV